tara:strand:+ start:2978 stop:3208 length:231 start_codon:yes stop_codon:yes gene_type:complete
MERKLTHRDFASIAVKGIRLEKCFASYSERKEDVRQKFEAVWGVNMASHFLMKYDNAEDLIYHLDGDNLNLFIEKF